MSSQVAQDGRGDARLPFQSTFSWVYSSVFNSYSIFQCSSFISLGLHGSSVMSMGEQEGG